MGKDEIIILAEKFSKKFHEGQKQVTGKPYFEHPQEVARLLKSWGQDNEIVAAGCLHDVIEDCNVSLTEIENMFGKRVAYLVDGMSNIRTSEGGKDFDATYRKFADHALQEPALLLIKLADMTANIPNLAEPSHREWVINKSYPRNMIFYIPFLKAVGLNKQADRIVKEFHKYTRAQIKSVLQDYISKENLDMIKNKLRKT